MENYLMLDGKKYELSPELANALLSCVEPEQEKKESPFERTEPRLPYWFIDSNGGVDFDTAAAHSQFTDFRFFVGNYCTDKSLMEQRALHETLNRLLWRYSEEHGGDKPWDGINEHWVIISENGEAKMISLNYFNSSNIFGAIYFKDQETALSAIADVVKPFLAAHPDFVW